MGGPTVARSSASSAPSSATRMTVCRVADGGVPEAEALKLALVADDRAAHVDAGTSCRTGSSGRISPAAVWIEN
jgi:hypothetical protein